MRISLSPTNDRVVLSLYLVSGLLRQETYSMPAPMSTARSIVFRIPTPLGNIPSRNPRQSPSGPQFHFPSTLSRQARNLAKQRAYSTVTVGTIYSTSLAKRSPLHLPHSTPKATCQHSGPTSGATKLQMSDRRKAQMLCKGAVRIQHGSNISCTPLLPTSTGFLFKNDDSLGKTVS